MDTDELNAFKCDGKLPSERVRNAAHDLLEALELARNEIKILLVDAGVVFPDQQETLWRIDAAIAKARGQ